MTDLKPYNFDPTLNKEKQKNRAKDTGMAMILISLLVAYFLNDNRFLIVSIVLLLLNMTVTAVFKPVAIIWFKLSNIMGTIMTRAILSLLFFILITPIGLFRRTFINDQLKLKQWKKNSGSVFVPRNHLYTKKDLEKPY